MSKIKYITCCEDHVCACVLSHFSHARLYSTPWTVARQTPLFLGFSRQEYWSGLPCPPPGVLPDPRIEPASLKYPSLAGGFFTTSATWEARGNIDKERELQRLGQWKTSLGA